MSHILNAEALARAPAASLAPFDYLNIVWAIMIVLVVFGQVPSLQSLLGMASILMAAALATKPRT